MKHLVSLAISAIAFTMIGCGGSVDNIKEAPALSSRIDTISYFIGYNNGKGFADNDLKEIDMEILVGAMKEAIEGGESKVDLQIGSQVIRTYMTEKQDAAAAENLVAGQKFLEENKTKDGVITTDSGLQYIVMKEGEGATPTAEDRVRVHYHGTLTDGTVFESSVENGTPAEFQVGGVIKGWTEGLQLMKVGGKNKFFIKPELAYGERGSQGMQPNSTLIFEVELLDIITPPAAE